MLNARIEAKVAEMILLSFLIIVLLICIIAGKMQTVNIFFKNYLIYVLIFIQYYVIIMSS